MKQSTHEKIRKKHDNLVNLVFQLYDYIGVDVEQEKDYSRGNLDIYIPRQQLYIPEDHYMEIKCNYSDKAVKKAKGQIDRAIKYNQCHTGCIVTFQGLYRY